MRYIMMEVSNDFDDWILDSDDDVFRYFYVSEKTHDGAVEI